MLSEIVVSGGDLSVSALMLISVLAFLTFVVSSAVGIGGTLVLVPVLIFFIPAAQAVAVTAPVMLINNCIKLSVFHAHVRWRSALWAALPAWPCAAFAATYTHVVEESVLRMAIASVIAVYFFVEFAFKLKLKIEYRGLIPFGIATGLASGFCGAAGVPAAFAYRAHGLVKESFVGTISVIAIGLQLSKIPVYSSTNLISVTDIPFILLLGLTSFCGILTGKRVLKKLSPRFFRIVLDALLGSLAVWLFVSGLSN